MKRRKYLKPATASQLLELYTIEEIIEMSDITLEDAIIVLAEAGLLKTPEITPLD